MKARRGIVLRSLSFGKYRVWDVEAKRAYDSRPAVINESLFPGLAWRCNQANEAAIQKWCSSISGSIETGDNFIHENTGAVANQRQENDKGGANGETGGPLRNADTLHVTNTTAV